MKDSCPLRKEYAEYSGLEATYADSGIEYPRRDYCAWLEKELAASRDSRILSAVPSEEIQQLVNEALTTDGGHHKQWYIEKIADKLGLLTIIEHDEGIAP